MRTKNLGDRIPCTHCEGKGYIYNNNNIGFIPPSMEQVKEYAISQDYPELDEVLFFEFYRAREWKFPNGKPMINWKLSVHVWKKNSKRSTKKSKKGTVKKVAAKDVDKNTKKAAGVLVNAYSHITGDKEDRPMFYAIGSEILKYFKALPIPAKSAFAGGPREFLNDYREFLQDKYNQWPDMRPGMLGVGREPWKRFIRFQEESIGVDFMTGKGKW